MNSQLRYFLYTDKYVPFLFKDRVITKPEVKLSQLIFNSSYDADHPSIAEFDSLEAENFIDVTLPKLIDLNSTQQKFNVDKSTQLIEHEVLRTDLYEAP